MNYRLKIAALIVMSLPYTHYVSALFDVDVTVNVTQKTAIANCTGGNNICNVTLGSVGEVVTFDAAGKPKIDLGTLAKERLIALELPAVPDTYKIYTLRPSTGSLANKEITLLLHNDIQKPGSRLSGNTVIKLFRQVEGDKSTQWMKVADFIMGKKEQAKELSFIVKPEGTFISFDTARVSGSGPQSFNPRKKLPEGVRQEVLYIGSKDLNH